MIELRLSPFKPGKDISSNEVFYNLYKDDKLIDRTLYTTILYTRSNIKGIVLLNKREVSEIEPKIWHICREKYKNYPRYHMSSDIVVVNGEIGQIILDTNNSNIIANEVPYVINDYIFAYNNSIYDNKGNLIKSFNCDINIDILNDTIIIRTTSGYTTQAYYIFDKFGKLINEYK